MSIKKEGAQVQLVQVRVHRMPENPIVTPKDTDSAPRRSLVNWKSE